MNKLIRITDDFYCTPQEFGGVKKHFGWLYVIVNKKEICLTNKWEICCGKTEEEKRAFFKTLGYDTDDWQFVVDSEFNRILKEYQEAV
jgi:hypothetical protein